MKRLLLLGIFTAATLLAHAQMRTNGYSTWLSRKIDGRFSSVSGWFALESLPTDTAAFIGVKDTRGRYVTVSVDLHGHLLLGLSGKYERLNEEVEAFRWYHILIDLKCHDIYINGRNIAHDYQAGLSYNGQLTLWAGKDFTNRHDWDTDLNVINGLIDEVKASSEPVEAIFLKANIGWRMNQKPDLSIPDNHFQYAFSRPRYHLLPAANWTNETHGLLYFNGTYHIFNQKNASNILLRQINWGHFSSPDLIHWTEERPALRPSEPYDNAGIWSGHAMIDDNGVPVIFYTGGSEPHSVNAAFPLDSTLIHWQKYAGNPIIKDRPSEYSRTDMRDPYVFRADSIWYMVVGFGIDRTKESHGALLLYKSTDLKTWEYRHLLFEGNPRKDHSGKFWEMPVFKKMGRKWILSINRIPERGIPARTQYWIGEFKHEKFVPDKAVPQNLEVVNRLLSPSVWDTPDGRTIALAIIPDEINAISNAENGWAHLYSIPREWSFNGKKILQKPYKGLEVLRAEKSIFEERVLGPTPLIINKQGLQKEILLTFKTTGKKPFGITLHKNPDGTEYSRIYFNPEKDELIIDQTHSSLRTGIPNCLRKDHYKINAKKPIELHLFIDGSVVEGFINGEDAFTTRIFPSTAKSAQVEVFSENAQTRIKAVVYDLKSADIHTTL